MTLSVDFSSRRRRRTFEDARRRQRDSRGRTSYLITNNRFALWLLAAAAKTLDSSWEAQTPVDSSQRFHRVFIVFLSFHCFSYHFLEWLSWYFASVSRSSASILLSFFFFYPAFFFFSSFCSRNYIIINYNIRSYIVYLLEILVLKGKTVVLSDVNFALLDALSVCDRFVYPKTNSSFSD